MQGISTAIYYLVPLQREAVYRDFPRVPGGLPVAEDVTGRVFSLPMHPNLDPDVKDYICDAVIAAVKG